MASNFKRDDLYLPSQTPISTLNFSYWLSFLCQASSIRTVLSSHNTISSLRIIFLPILSSNNTLGCRLDTTMSTGNVLSSSTSHFLPRPESLLFDFLLVTHSPAIIKLIVCVVFSGIEALFATFTATFKTKLCLKVYHPLLRAT